MEAIRSRTKGDFQHAKAHRRECSVDGLSFGFRHKMITQRGPENTSPNRGFDYIAFMRIPIVICAVVALVACRPPVDEVPPRLNIISPTDGQTFHVLDTIVVRIEASDDRAVSVVTTELLDDQGRLMLTGDALTPCVESVEDIYSFPLGNIHMASGNYTLRITARDNDNTNAEFVELQLIEAPLEPRGYYYLSDQDNEPGIQDIVYGFGIWGGGPETCTWDLPTSCNRIVADSWNQGMLAMNSTGTYLRFMAREYCAPRQVHEINIDNPEPSAVALFDPSQQRYFTAATNDAIREYDSYGNLTKSFGYTQGLKVLGLAASLTNVYVSGTLNNTHLVLRFNKATGTLQHTFQTAHPVTCLIADQTSDDAIGFLFDGQSSSCTRFSASVTYPHTSFQTNGKVHQAVWADLDANEVLWLGVDSEVLTFRVVDPFGTGISIFTGNGRCYPMVDRALGRGFVMDDDGLHRRGESSFSLENEFAMGIPDVLYNK